MDSNSTKGSRNATESEYEEPKKSGRKKQPPQSKDWCFTLNNPLTEEIEEIEKSDKWIYNYIVFQTEIGEKGTPHIQGFVQFEKQTRITALKHLNPRIHWEKRRGSPYQASHYCKKPVTLEDGTKCDCKHCATAQRCDPYYIFEEGTLSSVSSFRTQEVVDHIKRHGLNATVQKYPEIYMHASAGMHKLSLAFAPKREKKSVVTVIFGHPGTGKTYWATHNFPSVYHMGDWDGTFFVPTDYDPREHKTFLIDDFHGNIKFGTLKQMLDENSYSLQTKGGHVRFSPEHIVITSNKNPQRWYSFFHDLEEKPWLQLYRRIENLIEVTDYEYRIHKGELPYPFEKLPLSPRNDFYRNSLEAPPPPPVTPSPPRQIQPKPVRPLWNVSRRESRTPEEAPSNRLEALRIKEALEARDYAIAHGWKPQSLNPE